MLQNSNSFFPLKNSFSKKEKKKKPRWILTVFVAATFFANVITIMGNKDGKKGGGRRIGSERQRR